MPLKIEYSQGRIFWNITRFYTQLKKKKLYTLFSEQYSICWGCRTPNVFYQKAHWSSTPWSLYSPHMPDFMTYVKKDGNGHARPDGRAHPSFVWHRLFRFLFFFFGKRAKHSFDMTAEKLAMHAHPSYDMTTTQVTREFFMWHCPWEGSNVGK